MPRFAVIGDGRAGSSFRLALETAGWECAWRAGRGDRLDGGAAVDAVLIATPDRAIPEVAAALPTGPVVAHVSGASPLDVLVPHRRRASIHPLVSLVGGSEGAAALDGAWFAVAAHGDDAAAMAGRLVAALHGRSVVVDDTARAAYHAAAAVAANHLVGLTAQVERIAASAGVPLAPFLPLMHGVLDNVDRLGPPAALTGPVARGDWDTVRHHLAALDDTERAIYRHQLRELVRLTPHELPEDLR